MVRVRPVAVAAVAVLLAWASPTTVLAETPSPTPGTSKPVTPSAPSSSPLPGASPTPSASRSPSPDVPSEADAAEVTFAVESVDGPDPGAFYEDLGSFGFSGTTTLAEGSRVDVQRRGKDGGWARVVSTTVKNGAYAATALVQGAGDATFRASAEGTEGTPLTSRPSTVTVENSRISLDAATKIDSLKDLPVRGRVVPARPGVEVVVDVLRGSTWSRVASSTTASDGAWSTSLAYGKGTLARYTVRASYRAVNRSRWERSATSSFSRVAVIDAKVSATTAADVAKTYRSGCPVGPSALSTIRMNYYGRDRRMHRGVLIIRTDLRQKIIRGFDSALRHRYPVAKMRNPNDYGGNDPRQMEANNTSGFNCRKVVGNPYKMSPHSYGIAIDVNTVHNPFRDINGKWWPPNGAKYRDRTPLQWGMLGPKSWLTVSLSKDGFFWGGRWNPGRDYHHFEYRR